MCDTNPWSTLPDTGSRRYVVEALCDMGGWPGRESCAAHAQPGGFERHLSVGNPRTHCTYATIINARWSSISGREGCVRPIKPEAAHAIQFEPYLRALLEYLPKSTV